MLKGVYTAIITPFQDDGSIDEEALQKIIEAQIAGGIAGIVPCGTTGESPTLSHEEHDHVIELTVKMVNKRVPVIAGTGSNCTAEAIRLTKHAEAAGADAALIVNPYYNKPTQEGLFRHFKAVADSVKIPIIVYNIKGRTGVNVETDTLLRIAAACQNVKAVKEASGDINQIRDVIRRRPEGFAVLSGDDGITLELIRSGGDGVISVAGNVIPQQMVKLVDAALKGDFSQAEIIDRELAPIFKAEFIETNPIPIKYMAAKMGLCKETYRLPICEMGAENKAKVDAVMNAAGLC